MIVLGVLVISAMSEPVPKRSLTTTPLGGYAEGKLHSWQSVAAVAALHDNEDKVIARLVHRFDANLAVLRPSQEPFSYLNNLGHCVDFDYLHWAGWGLPDGSTHG